MFIAQKTERTASNPDWLCVDSAVSLFTETQRVLAAIELNGVKIDADRLRQNGAEVEQLIAECESRLPLTTIGQIWTRMFRKPTWSNRNELSAVLFGDGSDDTPVSEGAEKYAHIVGSNEKGLRLPVTVRTENGGASLEDDVLKRLAGVHPDKPELKEFFDIYSYYQTLLKLNSTYLSSMWRYMDSKGFIHPSFNLLGVVTYRTCLAGDTDILVCDYYGREESVKKCRIERIRPGDYVYCLDANLDIRVGKVTNQWKTGTKPVIRLHYVQHDSKPGYLDCTPDHLIRMADGEYCAAKDVLTYQSKAFKQNSPYHHFVLSIHAVLKPKNRYGKYVKQENHIDPVETSMYEITSIEDVGRTVDVYDIEVKDYHNFVANEICVHNSSNSPNIQNVPKHNRIIEKYVRTVFVPRGKDRHFVEVDYSGAEVRSNASINHDKTLVKSVTEGLDFHKWVAAKIYLLDEADVTKAIRQSVKGDFTFAAFYGSYWKQMALALWDTITMEGLTLKDGTLLYDHLKSKGITCLSNGSVPQQGSYEYVIQQVEKEFWDVLFKGYAKWKKDVVSQQIKTGYVESPTGFRSGGVLDGKAVTNMPGQSCLQAGSLVRIRGDLVTNGKVTGVVPIETLVGKQVNVWTGFRWAPAIGMEMGEHRLAEIELENGRIIKCDTLHKLKNEKDEWVGFQDLAVGQFVALPVFCSTLPGDPVLMPHEWQGGKYNYTKIARITVLDKVGTTYTMSVDDDLHQFVADGVITKNSAAHCLLFAMCGVHNSLQTLKKPDGTKMFPGTLLIGEIHDSLLADVPSDELESFLQLCHYWMCVRTPKVYSWLTVPMEIEAEVAPAGEPWAFKKAHSINMDYDQSVFAGQ